MKPTKEEAVKLSQSYGNTRVGQMSAAYAEQCDEIERLRDLLREVDTCTITIQGRAEAGILEGDSDRVICGKCAQRITAALAAKEK